MPETIDRAFVERLVDAVNRDPEFRTVSAHFDLPFTLAFGEKRFLFRPLDGRIEDVVEDPTLRDASEFAIVGRRGGVGAATTARPAPDGSSPTLVYCARTAAL